MSFERPARPAAPKVFLVMGTVGELSDTRTWIIDAYHDEARAASRRDAAHKRAAEIVALVSDDEWDWSCEPGLANEHDPRDVPYGSRGPEYFVVALYVNGYPDVRVAVAEALCEEKCSSSGHYIECAFGQHGALRDHKR